MKFEKSLNLPDFSSPPLERALHAVLIRRNEPASLSCKNDLSNIGGLSPKTPFSASAKEMLQASAK